MAIIERQYYSLEKSVKKINEYLPENKHIDIDDLLHFASLGKLEVSVEIKYSVNLNKNIYIEITNYRDDDNDEQLTNKIFKYLLDNLKKSEYIELDTNYGPIDIDNISTFSINDVLHIEILSSYLGLFVTLQPMDIIEVYENDLLATNSFIISRNIEVLDDEFPNGFNKVFQYIIMPEKITISKKQLIITKIELDRFIQLIIEDNFTIEDYQKILFLLKELVCSKAKKWSQDTINNELDNAKKGMSKRRLESLWPMLNKKYKP